MRLLKYSYCRFCGAPIEYSGCGRPREVCNECREKPRRVLTCKVCGGEFPYAGVGRPRLYCDECKKELEEDRRLYMLKYMDEYRERRRKMLYGKTI